jgi:hypothetical protein
MGCLLKILMIIITYLTRSTLQAATAETASAAADERRGGVRGDGLPIEDLDDYHNDENSEDKPKVCKRLCITLLLQMHKTCLVSNSKRTCMPCSRPIYKKHENVVTL